MSDDETTRVALACQGGGSHTAFTAGVLRTLLEEWDETDELVAISGTSGGAFNALAVWYGLVTGDEETAVELLGALWDDLAVRTPGDRVVNEWATGVARLESMGFPVATLSPYQLPGSELGQRRIRQTLERHIDFEAIPDLCEHRSPKLVVGTVDVNAGVFETFVDEAVTVDAVLASAAIPSLFEAVEIHGHYHWDGLFSQNPPIADLMHLPPGRKPEELWVVQVNPQTFEGEPTTPEVIADRRNELSGNISLNQELRFVEVVNDWLADGTLSDDQFVHTEVTRVAMDRNYPTATKLDRDPAFLDELRRLGERRAREFLDDRATD
jgi:NTE family protein